MSKALAVLISDVHYSLQTLALADAAMRQAIAKANDLNVPLIVAGDLHDTKANMRAECVNAMLETFDHLFEDCFILRGNHDAINEKSKEHVLNFLNKGWGEHSSARYIVDEPAFSNFGGIRLELIPYHHDPEELKAYLQTLPKGSTLIMHQGVQGSNMGDYVQDKSSLPKECFKDFRVISGHYHARQDIICSDSSVYKDCKAKIGVFSYIGNPYTLGFGEAGDPPKGFQVLMNDGSLEFVPTNLRKHVVRESRYEDGLFRGVRKEPPAPGDLVWHKITGTKEALLRVSREKVIKAFEIDYPFRLDLIPTDTGTTAPEAAQDLTDGELLDSLIDSLTNTSDERKEALKELWRKSADN